ncbi:DUF883 domain-containing protein [Caldimonas thermodepolymerans]|jgi:Uncharacterized conserved protein|nr:DUF883 family protein [Caldimonas thermodepolymerans]QPC31963.1 DUF883 domain-containing protein [Caldimonas thermodepolymerans]RDI01517.1 ElaB/YqjD/DUF883 family membrane-anchored ribosome-binding protein [Caldimonas thermodepolymerans]TCP05035.1 ElaB/YqjD/DUF883 family membrane-anchored ribosome-binding protein [Caldimonas thermodepolymerans]UZG44752.1 DUF883 family protein [Caldimonas thermodepolymerans]UZG48407.1 DUF883 family protein [Caldimonas thermodepolymerans]
MPTDTQKEASQPLQTEGTVRRPPRRYPRPPADDTAALLQREWADLEADVSELVSSPAVAQVPELRVLKDRLQASLHRAGEAVAEASHGITRRVRYTASATNDYVHEEPWKVAGLAALAGFAIGYLLGRR